ncbi:MAG TPA: 5'-nucleotidase [Myxococcaceae bacterium]|nr:5'-nucleotidase [Myxococcaceae bacterium]
MRLRSLLLALGALLLAPLAVEAAPKQVVLLLTGDNGGEIAPCGCRHGPSGGLARRKTALAKERDAGVPVRVLDAGNALFKSAEYSNEPGVKARAELLLEQMDALGTTAMAVGARDLVNGTGFLLQSTRRMKTKMKLLSANLVGEGKKRIFPASTVVTVGGVKFGVVGLSPEGSVEGESAVVGQAPAPAALAEARRLREKEKVDVVVVLAALPYEEATRLTGELGDAVDFVVQSHEGRGEGMAQRNGFAALIPSGERGRQLARLELSIDGPGPFADLAEAERSREGLARLEANIRRAKQRLEEAQGEVLRKSLSEAQAQLESRRAQLVANIEANTGDFKRTQRLSFILLGSEVEADPELQKRVERLEPPGSVNP